MKKTYSVNLNDLSVKIEKMVFCDIGSDSVPCDGWKVVESGTISIASSINLISDPMSLCAYRTYVDEHGTALIFQQQYTWQPFKWLLVFYDTNGQFIGQWDVPYVYPPMGELKS